MVPKCHVPATMALTLKIGLLLLENTRGLKGITAIGWPIKKHMHFKQTQVMFSNSSHCFRHSSFMFIASSESILKRGFMQLSPLHYPHPTVHIKPCFLHEHLAQWQSVLLAAAFHYVKQVHCCIWNYVRKEWHFAVDDVWGNLQSSFTDVQVNSFGIYLSGRSVFKPSHPYNSSAIQQNKSLFPLPLRFFSSEFDFLLNTFGWFRNRGDSFSVCIGKSFPT